MLLFSCFPSSITVKDVKALLPQINYRVPNMRFLKDKLQVRAEVHSVCCRILFVFTCCSCASLTDLCRTNRRWRPGATCPTPTLHSSTEHWCLTLRGVWVSALGVAHKHTHTDRRSTQILYFQKSSYISNCEPLLQCNPTGQLSTSKSIH